MSICLYIHIYIYTLNVHSLVSTDLLTLLYLYLRLHPGRSRRSNQSSAKLPPRFLVCVEGVTSSQSRSCRSERPRWQTAVCHHITSSTATGDSQSTFWGHEGPDTVSSSGSSDSDRWRSPAPLREQRRPETGYVYCCSECRSWASPSAGNKLYVHVASSNSCWLELFN